MVDGPIFVRWNGLISNQERVRFRLQQEVGLALGVSARELEAEIAEWHYRRPVSIPGLPFFAVRPFWKHGQKAPPLPPGLTRWHRSQW